MKVSSNQGNDKMLLALEFEDVDRWEDLEFSSLCDELKGAYRAEGTAKFADSLRDAFVDLRVVSGELLERLSKYCHTGGAWAGAIVPAQKAGRFLLLDYGLPRLLDGDDKRVPTYAEDVRAIVEHLKRAGGQVRPQMEDDESEGFPEGAAAYRWHRSYERSQQAVDEVKRRAEAAGNLRCEVCLFDFFQRYGKHGRGYIECHHRIPISEPIPDRITKIEDLALVCANCHRMLHRIRPWLTTDDLRKLLQNG